MSNYTKAPGMFLALRGANADPVIFDTELDKVATAILTKADLNLLSVHLAPVEVPAGATGNNVVRMNEIPNVVFAAKVTRMLFLQAAAPSGWAQDTNPLVNDRMLRIVSTATGNTMAGSHTPISGITATSSHALSITEMPAHAHSGTGKFGSNGVWQGGAFGVYNNASYGTTDTTTGSIGGTGAGTPASAHVHNIPAWTPKYIDAIICIKQ